MKALVIDMTRCNGCYNCQIACKDEHVGNDWSPIAKPQPDTGHFWHRVEDIVRGEVPKVKIAYMHHTCQQCAEAPCLKACQNRAIYQRPDGAVIIDPIKCTGRKNCLEACPYKTIYFNEDLQIAQKCTWCAHLLDRGWKEPRCVDACPTGALKFGEEAELQEWIAKAEILNPEAKAGPRVYYIGLPKRFIAGAVFDPEEDEVLEGVQVTVTDMKTGEKKTLSSDNFGDFWFEGLDQGTYAIAIEKAGYLKKEIRGINTEKDVNLGDLELNKAV
jgi:tetrathionate reductase subunit B